MLSVDVDADDKQLKSKKRKNNVSIIEDLLSLDFIVICSLFK
jgi:hypothetical protein